MVMQFSPLVRNAALDAMLIEQSDNPAPPAPENDNDAELQAARALLAMRKGLPSV